MIQVLVADYVKTHYQFTCPTDAGGVITTDTINALIDTKVSEIFENDVYKVRTQKLFIKDHIMNGSEDFVKDIKTENYVAMMYMPKQNVLFYDFNYSMVYVDLATFEVSLKYGNNEETLYNDLDAAIKIGENEYSYKFETRGDLSILAPAFTAIDTNNLSALEKGMSLIDLVQNEELDYSIYLTPIAFDEQIICVAEYEGVYLSFESDRPFVCVEYETIYE